MKIHSKKNIKSKKYVNETLKCNKIFYVILRELRIIFQFVYINKNMFEISISQIIFLFYNDMKSRFEIVRYIIETNNDVY